jgi:hypothetical protein
MSIPHYHESLTECAALCIGWAKEYLVKQNDKVYKEYRRLTDESKCSITFFVGFREFILIGDIIPAPQNPRVIFKTYEVITVFSEKSLNEIEVMRMTHHFEGVGGYELNRHDFYGTYFTKLDKCIYPEKD